MRQILLNSLPMHAPEKLVLVFFIAQSRIESCSDHRRLPICARLGQPGAAVPTQPRTGERAGLYTGGSLSRKSLFPVMIQAVHQRNIEENAA